MPGLGETTVKLPPEGVTSATKFQDEVERGERFEFGQNWQRFLSVLNDSRIKEAEESLGAMLGCLSLAGRTFIDVGSGSGLFSLAAMRLGAQKVLSFDFDPQSVACARALRKRYYPDAPNWTIEEGSALDRDYLKSLGQWDIVYSWGVLHHTGAMWDALANVTDLVKPNGLLFISIYNDPGKASYRFWSGVKQLYNRGALGRWLVLGTFIPIFNVKGLIRDTIVYRDPLRWYRIYGHGRGMSLWHDWKDWLGGYPYEVATPQEIFDFYRQRGFSLERLKSLGRGKDINQFVLKKA